MLTTLNLAGNRKLCTAAGLRALLQSWAGLGWGRFVASHQKWVCKIWGCALNFGLINHDILEFYDVFSSILDTQRIVVMDRDRLKTSESQPFTKAFLIIWQG